MNPRLSRLCIHDIKPSWDPATHLSVEQRDTAEIEQAVDYREIETNADLPHNINNTSSTYYYHHPGFYLMYRIYWRTKVSPFKT